MVKSEETSEEEDKEERGGKESVSSTTASRPQAQHRVVTFRGKGKEKNRGWL